MTQKSLSSFKCVDFCNKVNNARDLCASFLCISDDYYVYSCGKSIFGSHGHESEVILSPKKINNLQDIVSIYCGYKHSICLDGNGKVYSFGNNNEGQLGINKNTKQTHIPQLLNLPIIKQIACGSLFTMCLTDDGYLYSFGDNKYGQLGLGNSTPCDSPTKIPKLKNIQFIECGGYHTFCAKKKRYYAWGNNFYGQLGLGHNVRCEKPSKCVNWPDNITDIACGSNHSMYLTSDGHVYTFGCNKLGKLGLNDSSIVKKNIPSFLEDIPEIQKIECGYAFSVCIDIDYNLWVFGGNSVGQLGLGDSNHRYKPILHPTLSNIIDISSGGDNIFTKTIDNKIYANGVNTYGQIKIKSEGIYKQLTPMQVFIDNEDIWCSNIGKSKQKSARK